MNSDLRRLEADVPDVDFESFLEKCHVADIVKNDQYYIFMDEWQEKVNLIDETEVINPEARKQMITELCSLRSKVLKHIEIKVTGLALRKYRVVFPEEICEIFLRESPDITSKIVATAVTNDILDVKGSCEVDGETFVLSEKGWTQIQVDDTVYLELVSDINSFALVDETKNAEKLFDVLNSDLRRLDADASDIDCKSFWRQNHVRVRVHHRKFCCSFESF